MELIPERWFDFAPVPLGVYSDANPDQLRVNRALAAALGAGGNWTSITFSFPPAGSAPGSFLISVGGQPVARLADLPMTTCLNSEQEVRVEVQLTGFDGLPKSFRCTMTPIPAAAGSRSAIISFIDGSLETQLQIKLRQTQEEFQRFAYAASHDLQEPLRSIVTYSQLLQREFKDIPKAGEFVGFISEGVGRMNALMRDLLLLARAGTSESRTNIQLHSAVQWSLFNLEKAIREAGAQVQYDEMPEASVNETEIVSLFQNLISNAVKFRSAEPLKVHVSLEEGPEAYTVSVSDNGSGIESRYHEEIFRPFRRLHGREIPGTGMGLAICKRIVESHGGQIWVESDGTAGSHFRFTLPK